MITFPSTRTTLIKGDQGATRERNYDGHSNNNHLLYRNLKQRLSKINRQNHKANQSISNKVEVFSVSLNALGAKEVVTMTIYLGEASSQGLTKVG